MGLQNAVWTLETKSLRTCRASLRTFRCACQLIVTTHKLRQVSIRVSCKEQIAIASHLQSARGAQGGEDGCERTQLILKGTRSAQHELVLTSLT
eukprot:2102290-Amphidinium_carterae.1